MNPDYALSTTNGRGTAVRLTFGLVTIPIRIHLAADTGSSISRSRFLADGTKVSNAYVDDDGNLVDAADIVLRYELDDGWVDLDDAEIEAVLNHDLGFAEIRTFVPLDAFAEHYVIIKPAHWRPDTIKIGRKRKPDPAATKAAAVLARAMKARKVAAVAFLPAARGGDWVAFFPDGTAGYLAAADAVRPIDELPSETVTRRELASATELIDGIGIDAPILRDEPAAKILAYVSDKATGKIAKPKLEPAVAHDLMADLTASIEENKTRRAS